MKATLNFFLLPLFSLFFGLNSMSYAQTSPLKIGDEVSFGKDTGSKRFVIIGMDEANLTCSILNKDGGLDTVSMKKTAVVSSYKNELNRKRMSVFTPDTKIKWRQKGARVEGFLVSYSPADPEMTVTVYLDSLIEERRIPVKYATPSFEISRVDTLRMLCKLWESNTQLLSYPADEPEDLAIPIVGGLDFNHTALEKPHQYMFENFRFAQLLKDDLQAGIVGSWKLVGNSLHIQTKMAVIKDPETGKRKKVACKNEYVYQFSISEDGDKLNLLMPDWVAPPKKEEPVEIDDEEIDEEKEDVVKEEKEDTPTKDKPTTVGKDKKESDTETTTYKNELEKVRAELEALRREMREIKEVLIKDKSEKSIIKKVDQD